MCPNLGRGMRNRFVQSLLRFQDICCGVEIIVSDIIKRINTNFKVYLLFFLKIK